MSGESGLGRGSVCRELLPLFRTHEREGRLMQVSEALETVKRFGQLMIQDLPEGETGSSPEERFQQIMDMLHPEIRIPVAER